MKKLFALLLIVAMAALVACGPSAEEKAAQEKLLRERDSLIEKARVDSIAEVEAAEAEALAAAHQRELDSLQAIANAAKNQAAAAKKETKTIQNKQAQQRDPKAVQKKAAEVKAGQGKG